VYVNRKFERQSQSPLYLPHYQINRLTRFDRYKRRYHHHYRPLAAISVPQSTTGSSTSASSATAVFGSSVSTGALIYVAVTGIGVGGSGWHVSDNVNGSTNYYTALDSQSQSNYCLNTYCFQNSASGTPTITTTYLGGSQSAIALVALEIDGLLTSGTYVDQKTNSGAIQNFGPLSSGTMSTTTNANDILVSACSNYVTGGTYTDNWSNVVTAKASGAFGAVAVDWDIVSATGAYSDTWNATNPGEYFYVNIAALIGATVAATPPWGWLQSQDNPQDHIEVVSY
jgi:hypothetical protein